MDKFLEVKNLSKRYPGTLALNNVSCTFERGKVHSLLGKNGCGKSTFANIVSGVVLRTAGSIILEGKEVNFSSPHEAQESGVSVVHQEMSLIPSLSIAENVFLGRCKKKKKNPLIIDWRATEQATREILERIGIDINPQVLVSSLSIGQQQQIEIAKALVEEPSLLILDEPTSALALKEVDNLFSIMRSLLNQGVTMIYISHRLQELSQIAHTVNVLRDGEYIGTLPIDEANTDTVIHMMFGKVSKLEKKSDEKVAEITNKEIVLSVQNFSRQPFVRDISFNLYKGEILGIAGLMGSGRTEMLRGIYGLDDIDSGEICVMGKKIARITPELMKKMGISYVSEDRKEEGLAQILSSHENIVLASMKSIAYKEFITSKKREEPYAVKQIQSLKIKVANRFYPVSSLSGGNQQKVVVGNWLNINPKIMLFDEPSRGVDVEAKQQIFQIMWNQKAQGVSSIMISSELEELHEVCDRILILRDGTLQEEVLPEEITISQMYSKCMTEKE